MSESAGLLRARRPPASQADLRDALLSGGDSRLAIDPASGLNKYLCPPSPAPKLANLASCTASPVSQPGWNAARARFEHVQQAGSDADRAERLGVLRQETEVAVLAWFGAAGMADAMLAPSGTDAVLLTAGMLALEAGGSKLTAILPSASETGTGVPHAAACHGFDAGPSFGRPLFGRSIPGAEIDALHVALRSSDGVPRCDDALCEAFAAAARATSGRPVIYLTHGSKTGLVAPLRIPAGVEAVVDACQMRLSPAAVRRYLSRGWPVVVTGSKFVGGPAFSGAVLVPRGRFGAVRERALHAWGRAVPQNKDSALGPLLRWTAALDGLPALRDDIPVRLAALAREMEAALGRMPGAEPVPGPSANMVAAGGWPASIATFAVRDRADRSRRLTSDELKPVHRGLASAGVLVGQPVGLGSFGGLRIAASACDVVLGTMREPLDRLVRLWAALAPG